MFELFSSESQVFNAIVIVRILNSELNNFKTISGSTDWVTVSPASSLSASRGHPINLPTNYPLHPLQMSPSQHSPLQHSPLQMLSPINSQFQVSPVLHQLDGFSLSHDFERPEFGARPFISRLI